jgi:hypothetical protein
MEIIWFFWQGTPLILKVFDANYGISINTDKIIKSMQIAYLNFVYDSNISEEVISFRYLGIDLLHKLN